VDKGKEGRERKGGSKEKEGKRGEKRGGKEKEPEGNTRHTNPSLLLAPLMPSDIPSAPSFP